MGIFFSALKNEYLTTKKLNQKTKEMKTITKALGLISLIVAIVSCVQKKKEPAKKNSKSEITAIEKADFQDVDSLIAEDFNINSNDPLIGSFVIKNGKNKEEKHPFMAVYSSQNYGTFYQVYCRPVFDESKQEFLKFLEFKIVNYKGPINLGLEHKNKFEVDYDGSGTLGVKLAVKANGPNQLVRINVRNWNIQKEGLKALNIYRVLSKMYSGNIAIQRNRMFDSEFYTRSGLGVPIKKKLVPGLEGYENDESDIIKDEYNMKNLLLIDPSKDINLLGAGLNCYSATNMVMWE
jgi:hypothetical protein